MKIAATPEQKSRRSAKESRRRTRDGELKKINDEAQVEISKVNARRRSRLSAVWSKWNAA